MALESTMDACDRVSTVAGQAVEAQRTGKPLAPSVLNYYTEQLEQFAQQRAHMRIVIAKWWDLIDPEA
jgi:hypothetical protein